MLLIIKTNGKGPVILTNPANGVLAFDANLQPYILSLAALVVLLQS